MAFPLTGLALSARRVTIDGVEVTAADIAKIPARNLHVPRGEFVAVWIAAERQAVEKNDWYSAGVVAACRWLARAQVRPETGPWYMAPAPVTRRQESAYEELIEAECLKAELLYFRRPVPQWLQNRPGWARGIFVTLNWAWRHQGQPPIDVDQAAAS